MGHVRKPHKLFIWRDQSLFLSNGPIQNHSYKTNFHKLVLALDRDIELELDNGKHIQTRSYLIRAGSQIAQSLADDKSEKAIYYLASTTQDYHALASVMTPATKHIAYDHPNDKGIANACAEIKDGNYSPDSLLDRFRALMFPKHLDQNIYVEFDPRVIEVIRLIEEGWSENISLTELAETVCLSPSRLEKLFKQQVGIPITTYRIRFRVFLGIIHLCMGASVTDAALAAGFSHLAHFSRSFAALNGIQPTAIFSTPARLESYISNEITNDPNLLGYSYQDVKNRIQNNQNLNYFSVRLG